MPDPIACSELLLRAVRRRHLSWNGDRGRVEVHYGAFLLRLIGGHVEEDLSVDRASLSTPVATLARLPDNCWALLSLHTGRVRDLGLTVAATPSRMNPSHASIYGIPNPFGTAEEIERAVDAAKALLTAARTVETCRFESLEELAQRVRLLPRP